MVQKKEAKRKKKSTKRSQMSKPTPAPCCPTLATAETLNANMPSFAILIKNIIQKNMPSILVFFFLLFFHPLAAFFFYIHNDAMGTDYSRVVASGDDDNLIFPCTFSLLDFASSA